MESFTSGWEKATPCDKLLCRRYLEPWSRETFLGSGESLSTHTTARIGELPGLAGHIPFWETPHGVLQLNSRDYQSLAGSDLPHAWIRHYLFGMEIPESMSSR